MHIAFAISFFLYVGLSETLRHGVFGLNASETSGILTAILIGLAVLFLRGDLVHLLQQPKNSLYGSSRLMWSWKRTILGLFLSPLLLVGPIVLGITLIQINFHAFDGILLLTSGATMALFVAIAHELFFRETVIKAFAESTPAMVMASALAYFTVSLPGGLALALIMTGSGLFFLTLRLIGTNILVVAGLHAANTIFWGHVLSMGRTSVPDMTYAAYYLGCAALVSCVIYYLFAETKREYFYA